MDGIFTWLLNSAEEGAARHRAQFLELWARGDAALRRAARTFADVAPEEGGWLPLESPFWPRVVVALSAEGFDALRGDLAGSHEDALYMNCTESWCELARYVPVRSRHAYLFTGLMVAATNPALASLPAIARLVREFSVLTADDYAALFDECLRCYNFDLAQMLVEQRFYREHVPAVLARIAGRALARGDLAALEQMLRMGADTASGELLAQAVELDNAGAARLLLDYGCPVRREIKQRAPFLSAPLRELLERRGVSRPLAALPDGQSLRRSVAEQWNQLMVRSVYASDAVAGELRSPRSAQLPRPRTA